MNIETDRLAAGLCPKHGTRLYPDPDTPNCMGIVARCSRRDCTFTTLVTHAEALARKWKTPYAASWLE